MRQLYLDFGQKDFGGKECPQCGLRYDPSFPEDVKLHSKMHLAPKAVFPYHAAPSDQLVCRVRIGAKTDASQSALVTIASVCKHRKMLPDLWQWICESEKLSLPVPAKIPQAFLAVHPTLGIIGALFAVGHSVEGIWVQGSWRRQHLATTLFRIALASDPALAMASHLLLMPSIAQLNHSA